MLTTTSYPIFSRQESNYMETTFCTHKLNNESGFLLEFALLCLWLRWVRCLRLCLWHITVLSGNIQSIHGFSWFRFGNLELIANFQYIDLRSTYLITLNYASQEPIWVEHSLLGFRCTSSNRLLCFRKFNLLCDDMLFHWNCLVREDFYDGYQINVCWIRWTGQI